MLCADIGRTHLQRCAAPAYSLRAHLVGAAPRISLSLWWGRPPMRAVPAAKRRSSIALKTPPATSRNATQLSTRSSTRPTMRELYTDAHEPFSIPGGPSPSIDGRGAGRLSRQLLDTYAPDAARLFPSRSLTRRNRYATDATGTRGTHTPPTPPTRDATENATNTDGKYARGAKTLHRH